MDYKMLVLDLDDTLLNKEHKISEKTIKTLGILQEKGIEIVIATGRMFSSALPYIKQLNLTGSVINYNGAYIRDMGSNRLIYHQAVELEIARKIIKDAEDNDLYINIYIDDKLYVAEENEKSELYEKISGIKAQPVGELSDFISVAPTKILITENNIEIIKKYLSIFREKYGNIVEVTQSKPYFIEIMAKGVSKGEAIKIAADRLKISLAEVIAIGDSWNDIEMIKTAGLGIAMGNAPDGVKEQADKVAGKHDEEGVSTILSEIFMI